MGTKGVVIGASTRRTLHDDVAGHALRACHRRGRARSASGTRRLLVTERAHVVYRLAEVIADMDQAAPPVEATFEERLEQLESHHSSAAPGFGAHGGRLRHRESGNRPPPSAP